MSHPLKHAESSARKFGGKAEDYLPIHNWFDESKAFFPDFRHRALHHHAEGIFLAEKLFGVTIVNSDRKQIPVRYVVESMSAKIWAHSYSPGLAARDQATALDVRTTHGR